MIYKPKPAVPHSRVRCCALQRCSPPPPPAAARSCAAHPPPAVPPAVLPGVAALVTVAGLVARPSYSTPTCLLRVRGGTAQLCLCFRFPFQRKQTALFMMLVVSKRHTRLLHPIWRS